jgi:hypothetical protein
MILILHATALSLAVNVLCVVRCTSFIQLQCQYYTCEATCKDQKLMKGGKLEVLGGVMK